MMCGDVCVVYGGCVMMCGDVYVLCVEDVL